MTIYNSVNIIIDENERSTIIVLANHHQGLQDLEVYIKNLVSIAYPDDDYQNNFQQQTRQQKTAQIHSIIQYLVWRAQSLPPSQDQRIMVMSALQLIGTNLQGGISRYFLSISLSLIGRFKDPKQKVKLAAISGLYNLLNKYSQQGLKVFLEAFRGVALLIQDPSPAIQQAATFLNQSLKTVLNEAVFDQKSFDLKGLVQILSQSLQSQQSLGKQFILDWLMAVQQIPQFQLSFDLPLFFPQVFQLLQSQTKGLRTKAQQCLRKFLHVFRQIQGLGGHLCERINAESARLILQMSLIIVRQNLKLNPQIACHGMQWVQVLTDFFISQIQKEQIQLQNAFSQLLKQLILVIITSLSDESQQIKKISLRLNNSLLIIFPKLAKQQKRVEQVSILLQTLLSQSKVSERVQALFKWIKLLIVHNSTKLKGQIQKVIYLIVERLCDRNATISMFILLQNSPFIQEYFNLLLTTLLNYLTVNQKIPPQPIIKQLINLNNAQEHFQIMAHQIQTLTNHKFQQKFIQSLTSILISENTLSNLRQKLSLNENIQLFQCLFISFLNNQACAVILCFLAKKYILAKAFLFFLAQQEVIRGIKQRSLLKMSSFLQHSNMNHLRIDFKLNHHAVNAYLSLLMILPYSKINNLLTQRIIQKKQVKNMKIDEKYENKTQYQQKQRLIQKCRMNYLNGKQEQGVKKMIK